MYLAGYLLMLFQMKNTSKGYNFNTETDENWIFIEANFFKRLNYLSITNMVSSKILWHWCALVTKLSRSCPPKATLYLSRNPRGRFLVSFVFADFDVGRWRQVLASSEEVRIHQSCKQTPANGAHPVHLREC